MFSLVLSASDQAELTRLEEAMWRSETRFDKAFQEQYLAADFVEFGRSGRVYAREDVIPLLVKGFEGLEVNEKIREIVQAVVATYGPQDSTAIIKSVEAVELVTPQEPDVKIAIRDIVFHTTLLVPGRIEVQSELTFVPQLLSKLNAAMGY